MLNAFWRICVFLLTLPILFIEKVTDAGAWALSKLALAITWPYRKWLKKDDQPLELLPAQAVSKPEEIYIPTPEEELEEWYRCRRGSNTPQGRQQAQIEPNFPLRDPIEIIADLMDEEDDGSGWEKSRWSFGPVQFTPYTIPEGHQGGSHIAVRNVSKGPSHPDRARPTVKNNWMKRSTYSHKKITLDKYGKRVSG